MNRRINTLFFALTFSALFLSSTSAEVCKLIYTGVPEALNDSTIKIPSQAVMMSENILVGIPDEVIGDSIITYETPSIFFVIDNSGSMFKYSSAKDKWGNRFLVTRQLLDTINTIYPEAEVGVSVFGSNLFFDPKDDSAIISDVEGYNSDFYSGGYILLLKLDSTYNSAIGEMKGYDLLCHYLETDTLTWINQNYLGLKYIPTNDILKQTSTNITAGFDAVKDAYKKSSSKKKNQYVLFFSDGEASAPIDSSIMNAFKDGDSVPTTFTIYFTDDDEIPGQIDTMTQNIKDNKYSENNPHSNAWSYDNNGNDTLMEFVLSNIFSIINTKTISTPIDISVNGEIPDTSISNDSTTIYKFSKTFPFTGKSNDFHYEITYKIFTDSITGENDTIKTEKLDTIISDFTLELSDDAVLQENFDLLCWDRNIKFYYNNNEIAYANETMDTIEIRFTPEEIDTFYDYKDVSLELITTAPSSPDRDSLKMDKPDEYFSLKVPIIMDDVTINDNIIQLNEIDTIIPIFRNPTLPLDTLRDSLPFRLSSIIAMDEAAFFDNDANGKIDSVFITINGKDLTENSSDIDQIMENIILPENRKLEVINAKLFTTGISLNVNQKSETINTATDNDKISINQFIMKSGGWVNSGTVNVKDYMAPVIISAKADQHEHEDKKDTITIYYSEPIETIASYKPSLFYNVPDDKSYSVELLITKQENNYAVFEIVSIENYTQLNNGDSIWINWNSDNVGDLSPNKNYQRNEKNIKRVINAGFTEMPYIVESVTYFDNNADGHPDSLYFSVTNKDLIPIGDDLDQLVQSLSLPDFRKFEISKSYLFENGFSILVDEKNNQLNTTTTTDTVILENLTLDKGAKFTSATLPAVDKMAPVITSAKAIQYELDTETDSLEVTYSENINNITFKQPSLFYSPRLNSDYFAEFEVLSINNNVALFKIIEFLENDLIIDGDSIWINWNGEYVSDILSNPNYQLNEDNLRQPISVTYHPQPFDIDINVVSPINFLKLDSTSIIPGDIINILNPENQSKVLEHEGNNHGMIIKTETITEENIAIELSGEFTLYDYLGNAVIEKTSMSFNSMDNSLYYVWNGKNEYNRYTGSGTYTGLFKITANERVFNFKKYLLVKE